MPLIPRELAASPAFANNLRRQVTGEAIGTALLAAAIVGSGIMGERLAAGSGAIALFANTLATGTALVALILTFGPISGAHFNPVVTLAAAVMRQLPLRRVAPYLLAQFVGAIVGVVLAHGMFGEAALAVSTQSRAGASLLLSEMVATFGLIAVISSCTRSAAASLPYAVGAYITAAYWFTASTSFANPALTVARAATNSFAGINPYDVPAFIAAQLIGATAAVALFRWLMPACSSASTKSDAQDSRPRGASR